MQTKRSFYPLLLTGSLLGALQPAHAIDYTWDAGGTTTRTWQTAANWAGDTLPTFDENANIIFYSALDTTPHSVLGDVNRTIGSLTFNSSATTAMTLYLATSNNEASSASRVLTLGSGSVPPTITMAAASANHVIGSTKGSITLANNLPATINAPASGDAPNLTIASPIDGTGFGITKLGTGALSLSGNNTFTGDFILGNGAANSSSDNTATPLSSGFVYVGHNNALGGGKVFSRGAQLRASSAGIVLPNAVDVEGGGFRLGGANTFEISGLVKLAGGGRTFTVVGSTVVTLSGGVAQDSSSRALAKDGSGILILSGTSSYTGTTTVVAGVLDTTKPAALPGYASPARVIFNGGTLGVQMGGSGWLTTEVDTMLSNATKTSGALGIDTTNGNLTQWAAFTTTNLGSTLGLNKLGPNTLTLDQVNSYVGGTTVTAGTLSFANGALGTTGNITVTGGTLQWNGSNTQDISSRLTLQNSGSATLDTNGNNVTLATGFGGTTSSSFTKTGAGTLTLSAANTYTGGTTLQNGTLLLGLANSMGSGAVTVTGNATLGGSANGVVVSNNISINSGVTLLAQTSATNNLILAGSLTGSGTLQGSTGSVFRLFLNGNNSAFTGTVESRTTNPGLGMRFDNANASLPTGTLVISSSVAVELHNTGTYSFGTVTDTGGGGFTTTLAGAHTLTIGGNNNASSITGPIKNGIGTLALTKTGSDTLTLTNAGSDYTGNTTITGGTLALGASGVIPDGSAVVLSGGTLNVADGVAETLHSFNATGGILNLGGSTATGVAEVTLLNNSEVNNLTVALAGTVRLANGVVLTQKSGGSTSGIGTGDSLTFDVGAGGLANITGAINTALGDGAVNKTGAGTLRLSNSTSGWGGGTVIGNGTLEFDTITNRNAANTSSLGNAEIVNVLQIGTATTSATLRMIGIETANTSNRAVQLGDAGGTIDVVESTQTLSLSGIISKEAGSSSGTLTKAGAGTLTLSNTNTYSGATIVSAGTLKLGANHVLPSTAVAIGAGTLDADTRTDAVGTLDVTGAATIHLGSGAALAFDNSSGIAWTGGSLNVTGTLGAGSLRFGTSSSGLTSGQLAVISVNGSGSGTYTLDANGYLVAGTSTYSVTYNGNGSNSGSVPVDSNTYATGATVTVLGNTGSLVKTDFVFTGWNTQPGGLGTHYNPAQTFSMGSANVTLFAEWKTPYEIWAAGSEAFDGDANGDGVDDGMAWILGAATPADNALNKLPVPAKDGSFLTLSFQRVNPHSPAKLYARFGNDLSGWTEVEIPASSGTINLPGDDVEVVVSGPGAPSPDTVTVKIPTSYQSASGALFAKLRASKN